MERVLLTGAGGYVGTTLGPALLAEGYAVRAVDRFFFGRDLLTEHDRLEVIREDTRHLNAEHLQGVDYVIDLVGISNDPAGELFQEATWQINYESRVRLARMAKAAGAKRYILPSSCSIYGFRAPEVILDETSECNPLTVYAQANRRAEADILPLADDRFCAVVLRFATVFGLSPRMRFDLAINGMTYGAWSAGRVPLMRDGMQWRPMIHVKDVARAFLFMLRADRDRISGEIFNVGADENNHRIGELAEAIIGALPVRAEIEWYGDPDHRSYRVSFAKIRRLGYAPKYGAEDGAREIYQALETGTVSRLPTTITLEWYRELIKWHSIIREVEMYGGILNLARPGTPAVHIDPSRSAATGKPELDLAPR